MKTIALILGLAFTALAQQSEPAQRKAAPEDRDFSTPATRLVGRWQTADPHFAGQACDFYGPVDPGEGTGTLTRYLIVRDPKTKRSIWEIFNFKYRVISEDPAGERVTVNLLFRDGRSRTESCYIEHDGSTRTTHTVIAGVEVSTKTVYMDNKNQSCDRYQQP